MLKKPKVTVEGVQDFRSFLENKITTLVVPNSLPLYVFVSTVSAVITDMTVENGILANWSNVGIKWYNKRSNAEIKKNLANMVRIIGLLNTKMLYLTLTLKREQINYRDKVAIEKIYRYCW